MTAKARGLMNFGGLNDADGVIGRVLDMAAGGPAPALPVLDASAV